MPIAFIAGTPDLLVRGREKRSHRHAHTGLEKLLDRKTGLSCMVQLGMPIFLAKLSTAAHGQCQLDQCMIHSKPCTFQVVCIYGDAANCDNLCG